MNIEIVSIGSEIVKGQIINTNAPFIAKNLFDRGWNVTSQSAVLDEKGRIERHLKQVFTRVDIAIMTGGLGPTHDDITRSEICRAFQVGLVRDQGVLASLSKRYGDTAIWLENQILVPQGAHVFMNESGTAPGFCLEKNGKMIIAMPGVPQEMQELFIKKVLPFLEEKFGEQKKCFSEKISFCCLSESQLASQLEAIVDKNLGLEIGIYPDYGSLTVQLLYKHELSLIKEEIIACFPMHYIPSGTSVAEAISLEMRERGKTLVLAESCTGGAIAAEIVKYSKASEFFLGSFVVYQDAMKEKFLSIPKSLLQKEGAISSFCAKQMAESALEKTGADFSIATTGDLEKPGKVFIACAQKNKDTELIVLQLKASRQVNLLFATNRTLGAFFRLIKHKTAFSME